MILVILFATLMLGFSIMVISIATSGSFRYHEYSYFFLVLGCIIMLLSAVGFLVVNINDKNMAKDFCYSYHYSYENWGMWVGKLCIETKGDRIIDRHFIEKVEGRYYFS